MNDYMFHMQKEIVGNKNKDIQGLLTFLLYFCAFYLSHNIPYIVIVGYMVSLFPGNAPMKLITFFVAGLSSWWFHYLAHNNRTFNFLSGHKHHHKEHTSILEDVHEFVSDVIAAGGGLLVINIMIMLFTNVTVMNNYVLILFMFSFPLVHLLIYHNLIKKSYHEEHHHQADKNFSPDFFDHLFNTNLDHRIENLDHMIPIFVVVSVFILLLDKSRLLIKRVINEIFFTFIKPNISDFYMNFVKSSIKLSR